MAVSLSSLNKNSLAGIAFSSHHMQKNPAMQAVMDCRLEKALIFRQGLVKMKKSCLLTQTACP
jgi:hypothetical protein